MSVIKKQPETEEEYLAWEAKREAEKWEDWNKRCLAAGIDLELLHLTVEDIMEEVIRATELHGHINSPHEGYGVIAEEVDELWDLIKANKSNSEDGDTELKQIAAMAIKYSMDIVTLCENE